MNSTARSWIAAWGVALMIGSIVPTAGAASLVVDWGESSTYVTAAQSWSRSWSAFTTGDFDTDNGGTPDDVCKYIPFSMSTVMKATGGSYTGTSAVFYGGVHLIVYNQTADFSASGEGGVYNGIANSNPDTITTTTSDNSANNKRTDAAFLWAKANFLAGSGWANVGLDSSSPLTLTTISLSSGLAVRFLVKNAGKLYVSNTSLTSNGTLTLSNPTTDTWAEVNTNNSDRLYLWTIGSYATRTLVAVEAIGYYVTGYSTATSPKAIVKNFEASAYEAAVNAAPVIDQGASVNASAMDEDGAPTAWAAPTLTAVDADGDSLTWTNSTTPAHGTVAVSGAGTNPVTWTTFTYTPTANWNGADSFAVKADDGKGGVGTITVNVTVNPRNDPPNNTAVPTVSGLHQSGQTETSGNGTWNDNTDVTPGSLSYTRQWRRADDGAGLNAADIPDETNVTYLCTGADVGKYVQVRVTCTDNGEGLPATTNAAANSTWMLITGANAAPVIDQTDPFLVAAVDEDNAPTAWSAPALTAVDTDGDSLTWTNSTQPAHGTVVVSGTGTNPVTWAVFTYTPNANWNGTDSFDVVVSDGVLTDTVTVQVPVNPRNDPPVNTATPTVNGLHQVGQVVTKTTGAWNDLLDTAVSGSSTLSLTYQWQRADDSAGLNTADIADATNATYTLVTGDAGKYVSVKETCTDDGVGLPSSTNAAVCSAWTYVYRAPITFTAVTNGRFDASDADTWGVGLDVYPNAPGDTANIPAWTVTATNLAEVANRVTVNLSGTGILQLNKPVTNGSEVVHSGATVNVYTGATFKLNDNWIRVKCTTTLNGGELALKGAGANPESAYNGGVLNVLSDSVVGPASPGTHMGDIDCTVTGSGKLTLTNSPVEGTAIFSSISTWSGDWDIAAGTLNIANATTVPQELRIAAGAKVISVNQTCPGTITGNGTFSLYRNSTLTIEGAVSPGDAGVNGGVGMITVTNHGSTAGQNNPRVRFANNSTYQVDVQGEAPGQYDRMTITPSGTYAGTGRVDIATGAILDITLWTPPGGVTLDATVIDLPSGASGDFAGLFTITNWHNTARWENLAVTVIDNDLHVTGSTSPTGTIVLFF